jgi:hypothetical protein
MKNWVLVSFLSIFLYFGCGKSDRRETPDQNFTASDPAEFRRSADGIDLFERTQNDSRFSADSLDSNAQRDGDRRAVLNAQDDLNSAVRRLSDGDWDNDIGRVKRSLNDLEDANNRYSSSGGSSNLGSDIDRMRSQIRRLESDNWREVVPDIQRTNRSMDFESNSLRNE